MCPRGAPSLGSTFSSTITKTSQGTWSAPWSYSRLRTTIHQDLLVVKNLGPLNLALKGLIRLILNPHHVVNRFHTTLLKSKCFLHPKWKHWIKRPNQVLLLILQKCQQCWFTHQSLDFSWHSMAFLLRTEEWAVNSRFCQVCRIHYRSCPVL